MKIYDEFAEWFHLLTAPKDYAAEAADYVRLIESACPNARSLLELGSGGGNNASYLKRRFDCTLTDLSPRMLDVSRSINPECVHIAGDMRTLRLGQEFDAVFVHDAVEYMTTADDLVQVASSALCDGRTVRVLHDRHVHGLFTRQLWIDVLAGAGFEVVVPPMDVTTHETQVAFLAKRPAR